MKNDDKRPKSSAGDALVPPPPGGSHDAIAALLDADETSVVVLGFDGLVRAANESALQLLGADSAAALQPGESGHGMLRSMLDQAPRQLVAGGYDGTWQGDVDHIDATGSVQGVSRHGRSAP